MRPDKATQERRQAGSERWRVLNRFIDTALPAIGAPAALAWVVLFRHARPDRHVQLSQTYLARIIGVSSRSIRTALRELQAAGFLRQQKAGGPGRGASWYILSGRKLPQEENDPIGAEENVRSDPEENFRHYRRETGSQRASGNGDGAREPSVHRRGKTIAC